ncbi:hypothetical protein [Mariniphaga sediminis]|uniref:hypothetical protein n=1 Tax=Mariniphaga sediminis TaxID=1628158 RepID=UPI001558E968|nr:hypothetical protein [Mariniphaga sediminis]
MSTYSCQSGNKNAEKGINKIPAPKKHDVGPLVGHCKAYFPMILGNGVEHVLIGYSGAMGACAGHEHWTYNETHTGWYRPDTRKSPSMGVLNMLQCSYIVRRGFHAEGIDMSEQKFDAKSGILETQCHYLNADIRVKTFLTKNHILVHRFAVKTRAEKMAMQFFVRTAPGPLKIVNKNGSQDKSSDQETMDFIIEGERWPDTPVRLFCDHPRAQKVECYNRLTGLEVSLQEGCEFTFAVQCSQVDKVHGDNVSNELLDYFDYEETLRNHCAEWERFDSNSSINLPYGDIDNIYRTSLYVARAHQHPVLGGITVGSYPGMWRSVVYSWDMVFSMMALLGANRMKEAELGVRFWQNILPNLAKRNRDAGLPGVSVPGDLSFTGKIDSSSREKILGQRLAMTADISIMVWQLYQYSGHLSILNDYWDCLFQPLEFLMGSCVIEFEDHAEIITSPGTNGKERIDGKIVYYPNPTISLVTTIEALRGLCNAADLMGREIDPDWRRLLPKLERGINANRYDGVIHSCQNPRSDLTKVAHEVGLFNAIMDEKSILASAEVNTGPDGFMRWYDHGYRAQPWINCYFSSAFSRMGIEGAPDHVEMASKLTTTLGGFPEAIRPDGVFYKTWYPTVHGAFIHAVNLLLVNRRNEVVEIFSGVPDSWGDISFDSLRVPVGLIVSATRTNMEVTVKVTNSSDHYQEFKIQAFGKKIWNEVCALKSGETISLSAMR